MNNVATLEERVARKNAAYNNYSAEYGKIVDEMNKVEEYLDTLEQKRQELNAEFKTIQDEGAGLDILSKIKQGKFMLINLETLQPVNVKFI